MKRILFLCTHNSARSQMAEGLMRNLYGDQYEVESAGTHPSVVNTNAIKVMGEIGIDISKHTSKNLSQFLGQSFDYVITVCDNAKESCPIFPGAKKTLHQSFEDPSEGELTEEERVIKFREIRDEIRNYLIETFTH